RLRRSGDRGGQGSAEIGGCDACVRAGPRGSDHPRNDDGWVRRAHTRESPGGCPGLCIWVGCAWSHFLRKTGSPLFRKMLLCVVAFSAENRESTFPENASSDQKSRPLKSRCRSRRTFGSGS